MRIRCKPWAKPELDACDFVIHEPEKAKNHWNELFPKKQPIWLEVGCGKGGFISQLASQNQNVNCIAMDIKNEMLVLAKRKIEAAYKEKNLPLDNIKIAIQNISYISNAIGEDDLIDRIYINFCNPWPRRKHKKRRLTHPRQLEQYKTFLKPGGEIRFKTDDDDLFYESVIYFLNSGFDIVYRTFDLEHDTNLPYKDYKTEHEKMFSDEGKKIKYLVAVKNN